LRAGHDIGSRSGHTAFLFKNLTFKPGEVRDLGTLRVKFEED
jgi:hypothetical protein